jgi:hypothetical protein
VDLPLLFWVVVVFAAAIGIALVVGRVASARRRR